MSKIENRAKEIGLEIREYVNHDWPFVSGMISGNLLFISGHTPTIDGVPQYKGTVGEDVDMETAQKAAILCLENCLGAVKTALKGDMDRIVKIVKVNGFITSAKGFDQQAGVMNAVSNKLIELFGEKHSRAALGVSMLPGGVPVEVELIVEIK